MALPLATTFSRDNIHALSFTFIEQSDLLLFFIFRTLYAFTGHHDKELSNTKRRSTKRAPYCSKACDLCHMKKRKCRSNDDPSSKLCSPCARSGQKTCTYNRQYLYYQDRQALSKVTRSKRVDLDVNSALGPYDSFLVKFDHEQPPMQLPPSCLSTNHQTEPRASQPHNSFSNRVSLMAETRILPLPIPCNDYFSPVLGLPTSSSTISRHATTERSQSQPHFSLPPIRLLFAELESAK
ncbi:hypothetical protein C8R42DRAFT_478253 [Lentinula raphanica]|nr:hypothetical protein C8R42DRAFT_478253 [Lentinula raphanica]